MFIVEKEFDYKGYKCVTTFGDMGFRCGYVGVDKNCSLYGKGMHSEINCKFKDMNVPLGKRSVLTLFTAPDSEDKNVCLDLYFDVHGSISFAEGGKESKYPIESDLWWLGFDCGHAGDGKDLEMVDALWGSDGRIKMRLVLEKKMDEMYGPRDEVVRDLDYVINECKSLVDQIIVYEEKQK